MSNLCTDTFVIKLILDKLTKFALNVLNKHHELDSLSPAELQLNFLTSRLVVAVSTLFRC